MTQSIVTTDTQFKARTLPPAGLLDMKLLESRMTGLVLRRPYTLSLVHTRVNMVNRALHLVIPSKSLYIVHALLSHLFKRYLTNAFHARSTTVCTPVSLDLAKRTMKGRSNMSRSQIPRENT